MARSSSRIQSVRSTATRLVWLLGSMLVTSSAVSAAPMESPGYGVRPADGGPPPGGSYRGRYIGFVPKHTRNPSYVPSETTTVDDGIHDEQVSDDGANIAGPQQTLLDVFFDGDQSPTQCDTDGGWGDCLPLPRLFMRVDGLIWWTKGMDTPALATTSLTGTEQSRAGVLGQASTSVLFGDDELLTDVRGGVQYHLGWWLDDSHNRAIEFSYLNLQADETAFSESDADRSILARPFFNLQTNLEDARLIAFPNSVEGDLSIQASTDFQTLEAIVRHRPLIACRDNLDFSLGYRYAGLDDSLSFRESTTSLSGPTNGAKFDLNERFRTENDFHGGQFGVRLNPRCSRPWELEFNAKIALGNTHSQSAITGTTRTTSATGETSTQSGGLLAQGTNIGTWESENFSTITEGGVTLRRHLPYEWSMLAGYSFLYWTDVARAGDQIDRTINTSQIPPGTLSGAARPGHDIQISDFWAQGLRLGLEYNY